MVSRRFLVLGCALWACGDSELPAVDASAAMDAGAREDAFVREDARPRDATVGRDAQAPAAWDPTAPTELTGVRVLTPAYDADLAALLAFKRTTLWDCPGLLAAASCGDG